MLAPAARLLAGLCLSFLIIANAHPTHAYSDQQAAALKASLGRAALVRGQYDDADRLLTEALEAPALAPAVRIFALGNRGIARWRLRDLPAAVADFNAALRRAPEEATIYNNRGNVLLELKLYEEAAKDFGQAIALAPSYGAAYHNRGNARFLLGDHQASVADFTKAIGLLPRSAAPFNGRGKAQFALKRPAGAIRDFSRAIALDARYGQAYANRAGAMVALHRFKDAIDDYSSALQFGVDTPNVYRGRASVYARLNKQSLADKDMAEAAERDPAPTSAVADRPSRQDRANPDRAETVSAPAPASVLCDDTKTAQIEARSAKLADASHLSLPNSLLYRTKSEFEDLSGQAGLLGATDRTALGCDPAVEPSPQVLADVARAEDEEDEDEDEVDGERFVGPEVEDWSVELTAKGDYVARHLEYATIKLTLEMYGSGEPELLHWQRLKGPLRRVGLLHYYAGASPKGERLEYIALIDMYSGRLIAIEPCRWGEQQAQWSWDDVAVVVVDPQGVPSRVQVHAGPAYEASAPAKRVKVKRAARPAPQRDWTPKQRMKSRFNPYARAPHARGRYARGARPWSYR